MGRFARKRSRKDLTRELDVLCRQVVFARAKHACERCGKRTGLQWCHVYSRRFKSVRWDLDNSFCGCSGCHLWWHHRPTEGADWFREHVGEERYQALRLRMARAGRAPDPKLVRIYLEQEAARFGA